MKTESVWCPHCDHEHECEIVSDEFEDWTDVPERCEVCCELMAGGEPAFREDFHADG